jgi:hypothetical protein
VGNNPIVRIDPDGRDWYEDPEGKMIYREGSKDIEGYTNRGATYSRENEDGTYTNYYQNFAVTADTQFDAKEFVLTDKNIAGMLLSRNSLFSESGKKDLFNSMIEQGQKSFLENSARLGLNLIEGGGDALAVIGYSTGAIPLIVFGNTVSGFGSMGNAAFDVSDGNYDSAAARAFFTVIPGYGEHKVLKNAKWSEKEQIIISAWLKGVAKTLSFGAFNKKDD